jgi:hypothetical protein
MQYFECSLMLLPGRRELNACAVGISISIEWFSSTILQNAD